MLTHTQKFNNNLYLLKAYNLLSAFHAFSHLILIITLQKSGMILLIPYAAFRNKFSQVSVLEKFKSISFTELRGAMAL